MSLFFSSEAPPTFGEAKVVKIIYIISPNSKWLHLFSKSFIVSFALILHCIGFVEYNSFDKSLEYSLLESAYGT